ncbi:MAG: PEP-CTERM sorting domain-containing protein [Alphaproteobacteria bacterium]|nr:PEP-CTERM sorting domain-containing protein [Alphaproteobacteria bacterium]
MRKLGNNLMFGAGVALALAIGSQQANADVIFVESFEGTLQSETSIINGGIYRVGDFWSVISPGSLADINYPVGGIDGDSFFGGRDFGGRFFGGLIRAVEFQNIDISLYENVQLTVSLSSRTVGGLHSQSNYEADDTLRIGEDVDGGGLNILDVFDGDGQDLGEGLINDDNVDLTQTLVDFTYDIASGDNLTVRIDSGEFDISQFGGDQEAIAFDNIRVTGDLIVVPAGEGEGETETQGTAVPEPASLTIFGLGLAGLGFMRRRKIA